MPHQKYQAAYNYQQCGKQDAGAQQVGDDDLNLLICPVRGSEHLQFPRERAIKHLDSQGHNHRTENPTQLPGLGASENAGNGRRGSIR